MPQKKKTPAKTTTKKGKKKMTQKERKIRAAIIIIIILVLIGYEATILYRDWKNGDLDRNALVERIFPGMKGASEGTSEKAAPKAAAPAEYKPVASVSGWLELPAMTSDTTFLFITHDMEIDGVKMRNYSYYFDTRHYLAHWVAYPLCQGNIGSGSDRTEAWDFDPKIPRNRQANLKSGAYRSWDEATGKYKGGFKDRGHQIPSADRVGTESANAQTFYFTNMTPQLGTRFNSGIWAALESVVRDWARQCDTLYVVTGCDIRGFSEVAYDRSNPAKEVPVPVAYYKALLRKAGNSYSGAGIWLEHKNYPDKTIPRECLMSIDALEEKVGVDFFANLVTILGADAAASIEASDPTADSFWNF